MGYWVNTTYVHHGDAEKVAEALAALFCAEGMRQIFAPAQRERKRIEPMQYDGALYNDLWGVAVFPGAPSWTAIQTAPLTLLAECAADSTRMRLADLCARLSVSAFQLNVYDTTGIILAEASKEGDVTVTGFNLQAGSCDPFDRHNRQQDEALMEARFMLHPFQHLIADTVLGDEKAEVIQRHFGGPNAMFCDNGVSVDTLISHKSFTAPGGFALYFRWPGPSRQRFHACNSWDEYRAATGR